VTYPDYMFEQKGLKTDDGMGYTFQMNIFSHYLLATQLLPLLRSSPYREPRVLWSGSMDGLPGYFNPEDPQALESLSAYQSAKYCVGLMATRFDRYIQEVCPITEGQEIKSILVHPGILAGNMFTEIIGYWLDLLMKLAFYLARWLGSPNHPISPSIAAWSFLTVAFSPLASLAQFPMDPRPPSPSKLKSALMPTTDPDDGSIPKEPEIPRRFASKCGFWGRPYMGVDHVVLPGGKGVWWDKEMAEIVWKECEKEERRLKLKLKVEKKE